MTPPVKSEGASSRASINAEQPDTQVLIHGGDVVLSFASPDNRRLRVSSKILRQGSRKFAEILDGRNDFYGTRDSPFHLVLGRERAPHDVYSKGKIDMVCALVQLFHLNTSALASPLTAARLLEFGRTVDVFDCKDVARFVGYYHLEQHTKSPAVDYKQLVPAAYSLDSAEHFSFYTKAVVYEDTALLSLLELSLPKKVPYNIACRVDKQRQAAKDKLFGDLEVINDCTSRYRGSSYTTFDYEFQKRVRKVTTRGLGSVSIKQACEILRAVKCEEEDDPSDPDKASNKRLSRLAHDVEQICAWLCLPCVRQGKDACDTCSPDSGHAPA